jgi:uncharacterized damage-inducible protein DinB
MTQKDVFLGIWDKEAPTTRKVLERIPEGSTYRPDPKSRTAREIAWLIVREEFVLGDGLPKGALAWEEIPAPATMKEVLAAYDAHHDRITKAMHAMDVAKWDESIPFLFGGKEVMRAGCYENAWGFLLDMIHHRGQITTYLRPMGSTVPQIYGSSADEP